MLVIRLKRIGKKHQAAYRVVVSERRHKMVGEHTEDLGWFNPGLNKSELNLERIKYWMSVGAKPSETITNMLIDKGALTGKKIPKHKQPKKAEGKAAEAAAPVAAK